MAVCSRYSLYHRHVPLHAAVATSTAGVVSMIPEGLVLLVSLTYAAAALRMSRRGVLAQQLNAIESLASVDTLCIDKTGTLTDAALRVVELLPAPGVTEDQLRVMLGELAASATARNVTLQAIADACPAEAASLLGEVPFSSQRRWSAVSLPQRHALSRRARTAPASASLPAQPRHASARADACSSSPAEPGRCPTRPVSGRRAIWSPWALWCSPRNCARSARTRLRS